MKKLLSAALLILTLAAILLQSCGEKSYDNYTYSDGKISSGDKTYISAPMGFQPCGVGEKCAVRDGAFDLFTLLDLDGKAVPVDEWMTEGYAGAASSVYYREGLTLPAYTEIDYDAMYLCREDVNIISIATVTDGELIGKLIALMKNGASLVMLDEPVATYTLKFYSAEYPAIFFSLDYLVYEDASFIFNRGQKTYAEVTGLLDSFIDEAQESAQ